MKNDIFAEFPVLTLEDIDAVMRRARDDRAQVMRAMAIKAPDLFKRLAAALRPSRQRLPQAGHWAGART
jgi:hypothetical protein